MDIAVSDLVRFKNKHGEGSSLAQLAYQHITNLLLTNKLGPGDLINRKAIAKELNISVAPLLEAIIQLEAEGLLESMPRIGTRVRSISLQDLRGQLILREMIECEAARLYCGKKLCEHVDLLTPLAEEVDRAHQYEMHKRWQLEYEFHVSLIKLTHIPSVITAYRNVMRSKLFMGMNLFLEANPEPERESHTLLLQTLTKSTPDKASALMRAHLRSGRDKLYASY